MMLGTGGLVSPMITSVVSVLSQSPVPVIAQLYRPLFAIDVFGIIGFCSVELKPLGPVQL